MATGMIWFDNDPHKNINEKIKFAVQYYQNKFGSEPTLCFLNPKFEGKLLNSDSEIEFNYNTGLSPDHIWIGLRQQIA
jgi:hypothetical protein